MNHDCALFYPADFFHLQKWTHRVYYMPMTTVSTATLKQKLSHYLGLARQGKAVLITSHKRVIARILADDGELGRLPLVPPTRPASDLKEIGGFGLDADPVKQLMQERKKR
jgi:antitoxin (DNA-binding transcriptional repressor) of toxin-antitoxin stability system